jgi:hypothetical protein
MEQMPRHALRALLAVLVSRLEVDLETEQFVLELALPDWAPFDPQRYTAAMGLDASSSERSINQTQRGFLILIAVFDCRRRSRACFECRRRAA